MRRALPPCRTCVNLAAMDRATTRRKFLRLMAGSPLLAAGKPRRVAPPRPQLIERLIQQARALPTVSQRIDFISGKLLGVRYQANTLIGSPKQPETIRRPRRCVRLRDVLRGGAGGGHRPRLCRVRDIAPPHPLRPRQCAIRPAQSLFCRLVQAQHRERHLPAGGDRAVGRDRQDRHLAPRVRQASGVDRGGFQGDVVAERQASGAGRHHRLHVAARGPRLLSHRYRCVRQEWRVAAAQCIAKPRPRRGRQDGGIRHRQSGEICDAAAGGREHAGCGAPLKKRKARAPRRKPALHRRTQANGRGYRSVPLPRVSSAPSSSSRTAPPTRSPKRPFWSARRWAFIPITSRPAPA